MDYIPLTQPTAPVAPVPMDEHRTGTGRFRRRALRRPGEPAEDGDELEPHALPGGAGERPDPAQPLLEALDRLRVTHELTPAEPQVPALAQRAMKAYLDPTTRVFAQVPPASPLPPI